MVTKMLQINVHYSRFTTSPNSRRTDFNISALPSESNWTQKIILEQEKEELQALVPARKARLSGKRKVIDGGSLISTVEKLNGLREAERITR